MSSVYGEKVKVTIFGESHGPAIGLVMDGLPSGLELNLQEIKKEMMRRAPGQNLMSTQRQEKDEFIIESGMFEGKATGTPLCALILNSDQHSKDYGKLKDLVRPGHADFPAYVKYKGCNDYRGGGSFSGRLTAPLVFAGAVAKQFLREKGIEVGAHISSIGYVEDKEFNKLGEDKKLFLKLQEKEIPVIDDDRLKAMKDVIMAAREAKDSVGGTIECMAIGLPVGLGSPYFDSVESRLSHGLFSVPAVKALEFGEGFRMTELTGSEVNDSYYMAAKEVKTKTNNNGGVLGGITNGMPLVFKVGIKPTPSIGKKQETVNINTMKDETLEIIGRHDPCIVQRAVPVIEAVTAWVLMDLFIGAKD